MNANEIRNYRNFMVQAASGKMTIGDFSKYYEISDEILTYSDIEILQFREGYINPRRIAQIYPNIDRMEHGNSIAAIIKMAVKMIDYDKYLPQVDANAVRTGMVEI